MNPGPFPPRACRICGAIVPADQPCAACALAQVLSEDRIADGRDPVPVTVGEDAGFDATALPCRLGPFLVRRELAVGGMGAVYEAEDTRSRRTVALKLLRSLLLVSDADKARFKAEAEAASSLDHTNIVPVFEVGEHRRQPFFTMKLMEGGSLADRLLAGRLRPREAAGLVSKISRAVHHAHQRGVLHRDIKPGNVPFDATGEPQLSDFVLAKLVHAESSLTLSSAHLGTPQYMSPEQAAGRVREIGTASDVWALGALFYQLLAGRVPFLGEHHSEIFRQIIETEPRGMSDDDVQGTAGEGKTPVVRRSRTQDPVPADLETLCLRCLEKEPARRVASASELADELDRWLRGEPIRSRPVTPLERAGTACAWTCPPPQLDAFRRRRHRVPAYRAGPCAGGLGSPDPVAGTSGGPENPRTPAREREFSDPRLGPRPRFQGAKPGPRRRWSRLRKRFLEISGRIRPGLPCFSVGWTYCHQSCPESSGLRASVLECAWLATALGLAAKERKGTGAILTLLLCSLRSLAAISGRKRQLRRRPASTPSPFSYRSR